MDFIRKNEIYERFHNRFEKLYGDRADECSRRLQYLIGRYGIGLDTPGKKRKDGSWNEKDAVLITYGDMVQKKENQKLADLCSFLNIYVEDAVTTLHILPFFPYSSDEGFSVIDYRRIREDLGDWKTINAITTEFDDQIKEFSAFSDYATMETVKASYKIMADLVINHISRESAWFKDFKQGIAPARNYFIEVDPDTDLSDVTRPRNTPLLSEVHTRFGKRYVWTTFSRDQVDLDFSNPDVLFEFLDILMFYISNGISVIRLDAIAYLWKDIGTSCIHLPETHEVVRLIRDLMELVAPHVTIITETNVPHEENISYFGEGDEAHMVYQFSLPPLLLHALQTENAEYLTQWAMNLDPPPEGCLFFNFAASHDGIGVRPLEGLVPDEEFETLVKGVEKRGGYVSYKTDKDGNESPYELNITYFDAFQEPKENDEELQIKKFLCSQIIMLSLQGLPGIYFHSLTGTKNYTEGVEETGQKRSINRKRWDYEELVDKLQDQELHNARVFNRYREILDIRKEHPAFHPHGPQTVFDLGSEFFAFKRTSPDEKEEILVVSNVTGEEQSINTADDKNPLEKNSALNFLENEIRGEDGIYTLQPYETLWLEQ